MATVETRLDGNISPPNWIVQPGTLRSDGGTSVTTDAAGNIYVTGYTEGYFYGSKPGETTLNNDAFVVKYNNNGQELWRQQIGNPSLDEQPYGITVDPAGNVYITGSTYDALPASGGQGGYSDAFLAKFSSDGQFLWEHRFGSENNDTAYAIVADRAGALYVTGESKGYGSNNLQGGDAFLIKFDGSGTQLWKETIDLNAIDIGYGITIDASNNIYIAGETGDILQGTDPGEKDALVAKYDSNGNQLWIASSGIEGFDNASGITVDSTGNLYIAGTIAQADFLSFKNDMYAMKISSEGEGLWMTRYNEGANELAAGITIDANNNLYLTGKTNYSLFGGYLGGFDTVLVKLDTDGNQLGMHQIGTLANDMPNGIAVDPVGNVYVAGVTLGTLGPASQGNNDAFLIKYGTNPVPYVTPVPTNTNSNNIPTDNSTNTNSGNIPTDNSTNTNSNNPILPPPGKTLRGSLRSEVLQGDAGNDLLLGFKGNDRLLGLDGDDRLLGGEGRDRIEAGTGNDSLNGGDDNDRLVGGAGLDAFILSKGKGFDTIADFQKGEDQIILPRGVRQKQLEITSLGQRTVLSYKEDVLAVLSGVQANQFRTFGLNQEVRTSVF